MQFHLGYFLYKKRSELKSKVKAKVLEKKYKEYMQVFQYLEFLLCMDIFSFSHPMFLLKARCLV